MSSLTQIFPVDRYCKIIFFLLRSDNGLLGDHRLHFIKRVENYPDFEKLVHAVQNDLLGFIVKNIEGKSLEANFVEVGVLGK